MGHATSHVRMRPCTRGRTRAHAPNPLGAGWRGDSDYLHQGIAGPPRNARALRAPVDKGCCGAGVVQKWCTCCGFPWNHAESRGSCSRWCAKTGVVHTDRRPRARGCQAPRGLVPLHVDGRIMGLARAGAPRGRGGDARSLKAELLARARGREPRPLAASPEDSWTAAVAGVNIGDRRPAEERVESPVAPPADVPTRD